MKKILVLIAAITLSGCSKIDDSQNSVINDNTKFEKSISNAKAVELFQNDQHRLSLLGMNSLSI